ncbi:MAG: hypothetical protein M3066_12640 [Actinomycetota bacterium]|nr:hypothetical protein [Actinomycetota bacterium]
MTLSRWFTVTWALVLTLSAAACGSGSAAKAPTAGARSTIQIKDFAYSPTPLVAKVGDTITVKNVDSTAHTLTADDSSVDTETSLPAPRRRSRLRSRGSSPTTAGSTTT